MAIYEKNQGVQGKWVKKSDIKSGTRCFLVAETKPMPSNFKNEDGTTSTQDVSKIQFEGADEPLNLAINRPSLDALIDAFGKESADWIKKPLTAITEKTVIGGKRGTILYLVPDGYEVKEDNQGYVHVEKLGAEPAMNLNEEPSQKSPF